MTRYIRLIYFSFLTVFPSFSVIFADTDHLVFNRITIKPSNAEFVSIYNPTSEQKDLSDYYITDSVIDGYHYYNIPSGENFWSPSVSASTVNDFIARFPANTTIEPNDSLVLSLKTHELFSSYYEYDSDLSLFEDMLSIGDGSTISCMTFGASCQPENINILSDDQEMLMLFYWDGSSSVVKDVDYFLWGDTDQGIDKSGESNYLNDTPIGNQQFQDVHLDNYSYKRVQIDEGNEEQNNNGNGITGHDETSENLTETWDIIISPEIGCTDPSATNYNPQATISSDDDSECTYPLLSTPMLEIINNCGSDMGSNLDCSSNYDLSPSSAASCPLYEQSVVTQGIIVDYFDITPFGGPHSFTIQGIDGSSRLDFVIWPESSQFQDGFDITQSDLYYLSQNIGQTGYYEVQIKGELGAYCDDDQILDINSEWQITVEYEQDIVVVNTYSDEGDFYPISNSKKIKISPEPYVLIPDLGEKLKFSYTFNDDSQIRVRVFDISGRFIVSLVSEYQQSGGIVENAFWDGRNAIGQAMTPGTYLMHLEVYNFSSGDTHKDIAPVVIGVNQ